MKLLGKWGNKKSENNGSPSRSVNENDITTSTENTANVRNGNNRRKKKGSRGYGHKNSRHARTQHPSSRFSDSGSNSNSIISIPSNDDDDTIDALTLYQWSLADNAPSIGSAGELFLNPDRLNNDNEDQDHKHDGGKSKKRGNKSNIRNDSFSSSDGEEEDNHDDNDKDENLHFQYCKLSDSPPPKEKKSLQKNSTGSGSSKMSIFGKRFKNAGLSSSSELEEKPSISRSATPSPNKGRGMSVKGSNPSTPLRASSSTSNNNDGNLKSPKDVKARMQRNPLSAIPLQTCRRSEVSNPVDVDSFIEDEDNDNMEDDDDDDANSNRATGSGGGSGAVEIIMQERLSNIHIKDTVDDRSLPAELKGRIHALELSFEEDNLNSSLDSGTSSTPGSGLRAGRVNTSTDVVAADMDESSIKNVGDENSPFMRYRSMILHGPDGVSSKTFVKKDAGITPVSTSISASMSGLKPNMTVDTDMSTPTSTDTYAPETFSSTRNLGDMNTPLATFQKKASMEPDFTFSIDGDSGDSDNNTGATAWLLHKERDTSGSEGEDQLNSSLVNVYLHSNSGDGWEAVPYQADLRDSQNISSSAVATTGNNDGPNPSSSTNGKRFRKHIKNQVKNKFQSIVKKKTKEKEKEKERERGHVRRDSCDTNSSRIDKLKFLRQQQSVSSMAPLTGIENQNWIHNMRHKDNDLTQEIQRRKAIERREIERRQLQKQRSKEAEKWTCNRTDVAQASSIDATTSRERIKHRKKLQNWMMGGGSSFDGDEEARSAAICTDVHTNSINTSYPSISYEEDSTTFSAKTPHTQATEVIDNTTKAKNILSKTFGTFEPNFPDEEDSTAAQTPEASAPLVHQDFSCVICRKGDRTHLAVPCMHFSFCADCVSELEKKNDASGTAMRCLVCNEEVKTFSKVFY